MSMSNCCPSLPIPPVQLTSPSSPPSLLPHYFTQWELHLTKEGGWTPAWRDPLIAMVVIVSVLLSLLLLFVLMEQHRKKLLLKVGVCECEATAASGKLGSKYPSI